MAAKCASFFSTTDMDSNNVGVEEESNEYFSP